MTDHKFADDDVIKALECCSKDVPIRNSCEGCPFAGKKCAAFLPQTALVLINRQKAEIDLYKRLNDELEDELASTYDKLETARAEAIKEFAERLFKKCDAPHWCVWMSEIEDLVKEMTEENK